MTDWTPEAVLEKGERIREHLDTKLQVLGLFDVMVQSYGKDKMGIRMSIVNMGVAKKVNGHVLSITYSGNRLRKRSIQNLASGPYGQAKRTLKEKRA